MFIMLSTLLYNFLCRGGQPVLHSIIYTGDASQNVQLRLPGKWCIIQDISTCNRIFSNLVTKVV